jgi:hypothetical protein
MAMGAMAVTDVEGVGEIGEGSFLANDFFSLARLFWNHTFSHKVKEARGRRCVSAMETRKKRGGKHVPEPPWETS